MIEGLEVAWVVCGWLAFAVVVELTSRRARVPLEAVLLAGVVAAVLAPLLVVAVLVWAIRHGAPFWWRQLRQEGRDR